MYSIKGFSRLALKIVISTFFATILAFLSIDNLPGDSATVLSGITGDVQVLREQMGLNVPVLERYVSWILSALSGDLGQSVIYDMPVADIVAQRIAITMPLAIMSFILSSIFGVVFATLAVVYRGAYVSKIIGLMITVFLAVPVVWLCLFFILTLSIGVGYFPSGGYDSVNSYVLPVLALGLTQGAIFARYVIITLSGVEHKDFLHFARIKGATKIGAYIKHGLPAVAGSLLAIMGLQIGFLMTGVVVVERIFSMPGLGDLLYQSMIMRDIGVASSVIAVLVFVIICVNTLVDVLVYIATPVLRKGYNA